MPAAPEGSSVANTDNGLFRLEERSIRKRIENLQKPVTAKNKSEIDVAKNAPQCTDIFECLCEAERIVNENHVEAGSSNDGRTFRASLDALLIYTSQAVLLYRKLQQMQKPQLPQSETAFERQAFVFLLSLILSKSATSVPLFCDEDDKEKWAYVSRHGEDDCAHDPQSAKRNKIFWKELREWALDWERGGILKEHPTWIADVFIQIEILERCVTEVAIERNMHHTIISRKRKAMLKEAEVVRKIAPRIQPS